MRRIIAAGNRIADKPYKYGGGHGQWEDSGYDCSGSVSYALHGAGYLNSALTSGGFMSWGSPGRGRWVTIYAAPGHVYMVINGRRFDTSGPQRERHPLAGLRPLIGGLRGPSPGGPVGRAQHEREPARRAAPVAGDAPGPRRAHDPARSVSATRIASSSTPTTGRKSGTRSIGDARYAISPTSASLHRAGTSRSPKSPRANTTQSGTSRASARASGPRPANASPATNST